MVSASETAFFSLSPGDVGKLKRIDSKGSRAALKLLSMPDYLLATILILNNFLSIYAAILASFIIDNIVTFINLDTVEFLVKVITVTFMLLLFGEIIPKIFASQYARRTTEIMSIPLLFMKDIVKPFSYILIRSSNTINETIAVKKINISMDQLSNAIEITTDQTAEEKKMLSGIVNFIGTEVDEIMCPRVDIVSLDFESGFTEVRRVVDESGFSRIPVYKESIDNITGVLYVKDLIPHIDEGDDFHWQKLCRRPYFVHEHKKINDLFEEFQNNKVHMAIVVDEYGSTLGLISLEDILEEIVGEISDESDNKLSYYTKVNQHTYIFEGKTHLIDFLKVVELDDDFFDDIKGNAESIAGLMLEVKQDFLKQGESLKIGRLTLTVESIEERRIDKVRVVVGAKE